MSGLWVCQPGGKIAALAHLPGDFADWILAGMGVPPERARLVRPHLGDELPPPQAPAALVVTGSAAMVTDPDPWVARTADWLARVVARGVPVLGICFGHQLLAQALGGRVGWREDGVEVGTVPLALTAEAAADPLFAGLPGGMRVHASHRQSVQVLPAGARLLAGSPQDPHHAFRFGPCAWGVQFHPEFSAEVVRAHVEHHGPLLERHGGSAAAARAEVRDTPWGGQLLRRFAELAGEG